jgi:DNA ligase-1
MKPATLGKNKQKGIDLLEDIDPFTIPFPVYGTPKFDGIRCCIQDGKALTYNLKQIPNNHVRTLLEDNCIAGIDGELIVNHTVQDYFNNTQSGIMSKNGKPDFKFNVFDFMPQEGDKYAWTYLTRTTWMQKKNSDFIEYVKPILIKDMRALLAFERDCLKKGFEGIILRTGDSPYKFGRSTLKQFWMVKYKRFQDSEAKVIGFNELMSNKNKAIRNAVGDIKRSSKKSGMVPMKMLGSLEAQDLKTDVVFSISGFTLKQRKQIWRERKKILGRVFTYKYQKHGMKNKPRFDTFKGWRIDI